MQGHMHCTTGTIKKGLSKVNVLVVFLPLCCIHMCLLLFCYHFLLLTSPRRSERKIFALAFFYLQEESKAIRESLGCRHVDRTATLSRLMTQHASRNGTSSRMFLPFWFVWVFWCLAFHLFSWSWFGFCSFLADHRCMEEIRR